MNESRHRPPLALGVIDVTGEWILTLPFYLGGRMDNVHVIAF